MKMIVAIIHPDKLSTLQQSVRHRDVEMMTVSEVFGYGRETGPVQVYRGREVRRPVSKLRVEIAVSDAFVQTAVDAIVSSVFSDNPVQICDDKLFVLAIEECIGSGRRFRQTVEV